MKKNGFTLIELLAVIVILAIIALIATPIILGIINDAREKANERSVELYASAVRNAVAAYQLTNSNAPKSFSDLTIQYDGDVKCTVQELYEDGNFYLEGCKVNNGEKEYSYGTKKIVKGKISICNPIRVQTEGTYTAGDKYECDVDPQKQGYDQMFYVLNSDSTSVNLIMDSNIRLGGETVKESNPTDEEKALVAWGDIENGPTIVMDYLQLSTQTWTNVNPQTISTYEDYEGNSYNMSKTYEINARLPHYDELPMYLSNSVWLINYLEGYEGEEEVDGIVGRIGSNGIKGYWTDTLSYGDNAFIVSCGGTVSGDSFDSANSQGVRPVINLLT